MEEDQVVLNLKSNLVILSLKLKALETELNKTKKIKEFEAISKLMKVYENVVNLLNISIWMLK